MSYHPVTAASLTPSRPAPQAPQRKASDNPQGMYSTNSALTNSGYSPSFSLTPASPSVSSYTPLYTGIGGSPTRGSDDALGNSQIVRTGMVSIKEDGFASWIWKVKWLVLKEQTLTIHKNEVKY